jgi:HlyD family secretion protein
LSKDNSVFRKVSLDRLASPEQLDLLLPVVDSRGWVALAALGTVLLVAIVWSIVGSIPRNLSATGILLKSGGVLEVIPVAGGLISDVSVNVGDSVTEGQVVARMSQPEVSARLQQTKAALLDLRERHRQLLEFGDKNAKLESENLARQRAAVGQSLASAESLLRWTSKKIRIQAGLVDRGLLLRQTLLESREKRHEALEQIGRAKSELAQIAVKSLELRNAHQELVAASQAKIAETERIVEQTARELQSKTQIVAPYTGRVLEILAEQGMVIAAGDPILRLDLAGRTVRGLEAILFVPSSQGKQIQVGMPVLIEPATVKKEEYGVMLGRVTSVSEFPATIKGMQRVLKNEKLVETLAGTDAPYEVRSDLAVDPTTVSRYRWSSSKGPPERIRSGTLARASIVVSYRRPIELLIPTVRGVSGL